MSHTIHHSRIPYMTFNVICYMYMTYIILWITFIHDCHIWLYNVTYDYFPVIQNMWHSIIISHCHMSYITVACPIWHSHVIIVRHTSYMTVLHESISNMWHPHTCPIVIHDILSSIFDMWHPHTYIYEIHWSLHLNTLLQRAILGARAHTHVI